MVDLAVRLGLEKPRQRGKWACPKCGSRNNLHIYTTAERGAHCFGCGSIDAPGLVMAVRNCSFREALHFIDPSHKPEHKKYSEPPEPKRVMPPVDPDVVAALTWIYENCDPLSDEHGAWIAARGLTNTIGLKTATPAYWREVSQFEGSPTLNTKGYPHPWWKHPFIVVPYRDSNGIVDLRFRRSHDEEGPKMLSLVGERAVPVPFGGHAPMGMGFDFHVDSPVWIVEGEWDAMLLQQRGLLAFATPGAMVWHDEWTEFIKNLTVEKTKIGMSKRRTVYVVGDGDEAGTRMAQRIHSRLHVAGVKSFARTWSSGDATDLYRANKLMDEIECITRSC